jgi:hypothetical protein
MMVRCDKYKTCDIIRDNGKLNGVYCYSAHPHKMEHVCRKVKCDIGGKCVPIRPKAKFSKRTKQ